jgi:hypothetical protein
MPKHGGLFKASALNGGLAALWLLGGNKMLFELLYRRVTLLAQSLAEEFEAFYCPL